LILGRYNGEIIRYFTRNNTSEVLANNLISMSITGTSSDIYVRSNDGQVWGFEDGLWKQLLIGTDNDTLMFGSPYLFIKKFDGPIWVYRKGETGRARRLNPATNTKSIAAARNTLYFLKFDGPIWRWTP
jgi:hypothetical protein